MKKILSILTLLILVLTGQEVAFNADSGTIVQECTLDDDESSSSPDIELKKFEVGKVPLESHDITTRTISASDNYERLFKLSNNNKNLLLLHLIGHAIQYKVSETLSTIQTLNYSSLRKCGNLWIYVLRKLVIWYYRLSNCNRWLCLFCKVWSECTFPYLCTQTIIFCLLSSI